MHIILYIFAALGVAFVAFIALAALGHQRYGWTSTDTARSAAQVLAAPYWYRCLVAIDLCANVFLRGIFGMTISTRIAIWVAMKRAGAVGWFLRIILGGLERIQTAHGEEAESGDIARNTIAIETIRPWLDKVTALKVPKEPAPALGTVTVQTAVKAAMPRSV